jgi:streptogramin lyase
VAAIPFLLAGCASGGPAATTSAVTVPPPSVVSAPSAPASAAPASMERASAAPRTPAPSPTPTAPPHPIDSTLDGVAVRTLSGSPLSDPIDVVVAFGSVWVANHHGSMVLRLDPDGMSVQATIKAGSGLGWFALTSDAVWVSNQEGEGLTRIDPATNTTTVRLGRWATCGRPTLAFKAIWQPACDARQIMRIDPIRLTVTNVASPGQMSLVRAGSTLISSGPNGLASLDPKTTVFTPIGGQDPGWLMAFDGRTIWSSTDTEVLRVSPADGSVIARLPIPEAGAVAFRGGRAWLTSATGLVEVDPKTNAIVRTLPLGRMVSLAAGADGLWVTSYYGNSLTRVRL